jgi:hypothetical protein
VVAEALTPVKAAQLTGAIMTKLKQWMAEK